MNFSPLFRLGGNDTKPDCGNISWLTMLFAGGIVTVLMFWGGAEPISHFANPPRPDVDPFTVDAADDAGLTALQQVITVVGLPMFILVFAMMFALFRGFSTEKIQGVRVGQPPDTQALER